jgi:hypothetical protein
MPDLGSIPAFSRPKVDDSLGKLVAKGHEDERCRGQHDQLIKVWSLES